MSSNMIAVAGRAGGRLLTDPVRRSPRRYSHQGGNSTAASECAVVFPTRRTRQNSSLLQQRSTSTTTAPVLLRHGSTTSELSKGARYPFSLVPTTAVASSTCSENGKNNPWELLLSAFVALASSAALVVAFPSSRLESRTTTSAASEGFLSSSFARHQHQVGGGGGGGGGSSGGPSYTSIGYAVAPYVDEDYENEPENSKDKEEPSTSMESVSGRKIYDVSVRAIKGGRVTMEDEYFVTDGGRFAAVFDGHGGGGVSGFLKRHLYDTVKKCVAVKQWEDDKKPHEKLSVAGQAQALRAAFNQVDTAVLQEDALRFQGSTAVAVVMHESEDGHRTLLSANVGDSRAILSRRGKALDLTKDHKPNDEREKARILSMGETIEWDRFAKVHRVRNLSLSRAIGDKYAKPVVSGEVEIKHFPVVDDGDEFILLASDGVWDVMTSQDVVTYVHNQIQKEMKRGAHDPDGFKRVLRKNMAKFVAREALRRGSGDNICVLMVWLNDLGSRVPPHRSG